MLLFMIDFLPLIWETIFITVCSYYFICCCFTYYNKCICIYFNNFTPLPFVFYIQLYMQCFILVYFLV